MFGFQDRRADHRSSTNLSQPGSGLVLIQTKAKPTPIVLERAHRFILQESELAMSAGSSRDLIYADCGCSLRLFA